MTKRDIVKRIVRFTVGSCVATTVTQVLANNSTPENALEKTEVVIGSLVVGAIAADVSRNYTDRVVDEMFNAFSKS